ncbi:MAG: ECF transporter S component [Bacteroidales bacterium]|jgi:hypothetical protein|nr:ECF transporter S component [Bacteroidales bacterium]
MEKTVGKIVNLYSLSFSELKTYLFALLFIGGNIILPQISHLIPQGGLIFLPIYFFTLIAAYKYGIGVGLLTAVCSPLINSLLFGMPPVGSLPIILVKSVLLAVAGAYMAHRLGKISLWGIIVVVLAYQLVGTAVEWLIEGSFLTAVKDFTKGWAGMLMQIFGGYFLLKAIAKL